MLLDVERIERFEALVAKAPGKEAKP